MPIPYTVHQHLKSGVDQKPLKSCQLVLLWDPTDLKFSRVIGPAPGVQPPKPTRRDTWTKIQPWPQAAKTGLYYAQITYIIVVVFAELHGTISLEN
jgi:hypothetical protein